jgi:hypothetical protein
VYSLAVGKAPKSDTAKELMGFEGISKDAIVMKIREILGK